MNTGDFRRPSGRAQSTDRLTASFPMEKPWDTPSNSLASNEAWRIPGVSCLHHATPHMNQNPCRSQPRIVEIVPTSYHPLFPRLASWVVTIGSSRDSQDRSRIYERRESPTRRARTETEYLSVVRKASGGSPEVGLTGEWRRRVFLFQSLRETGFLKYSQG